MLRTAEKAADGWPHAEVEGAVDMSEAGTFAAGAGAAAGFGVGVLRRSSQCSLAARYRIPVIPKRKYRPRN